MTELEAIRERYTRWEGCGYVSNADFLAAGNDVRGILTLLDKGREIVEELERVLTYTQESRDAHSAGWTNCVIELGETRVKLKEALDKL